MSVLSLYCIVVNRYMSYTTHNYYCNHSAQTQKSTGTSFEIPVNFDLYLYIRHVVITKTLNNR